jgi:acetylornithine deacetylase/succinyl-diaminopimelate desuccinylase-like protein
VRRHLLGVALLVVAAVPAASSDDLRARVESYVAAHEKAILAELAELVSIPNVASDRANIRRNAERLAGMLSRRGLRAEILETAGNPLVYGERPAAGAKRTLLFYAHYDGQPVDPRGWKQASPFRPIVRAGRMEAGAREVPEPLAAARLDPEWRLYARSAADDKAPIVALCAALDALAAAGREPASNIRVILDGEEEAGSASLEPAIGRYREKLGADLLLILDGPVHPSGRATLNFGARGIVTLELTVYGPKTALHSGHYGNWVPNPALALARLLASIKDEDGRVRVAGFYDGVAPLGPEERRILAAVPDDLEALGKLFGIARPDRVGASLQEALQYPSLNIRGLRSAYVGADARTIIPSEATAALDLRLVKETPSAQLVEKVLGHIRQQGFHIVEGEPDDDARLGYPKIVRVARGSATEAYRTAMELPESQWAAAALERAWGEAPVRIRTSGGTVPISPFIGALGVPAISVPIVNFDNNQHGENENLRLGHLWRGIITIAALLGS